MSKEYRLKLTVRNNLLLSAIESAGFESQADFARANGLTPAQVNALVAMREAPIGRDGSFGTAALKIMEALGASPSDLWSDEQLYMNLSRNSASAEVGAAEVRALMGDACKPLELAAPDEAMRDGELRKVVALVLKDLSERERAIVRLRYGLDTDLEMTEAEIGDRFEVSAGRIHQILRKAKRKIRSAGVLVNAEF